MPSFGRNIKISVFWIFKHFRTWNLAHLTVIDSTVSPDHADTLRVNLSYNRIDRFHISSLKQFERPVKGMKCGLAWTKVLSLYMWFELILYLFIFFPCDKDSVFSTAVALGWDILPSGCSHWDLSDILSLPEGRRHLWHVSQSTSSVMMWTLLHLLPHLSSPTVWKMTQFLYLIFVISGLHFFLAVINILPLLPQVAEGQILSSLNSISHFCFLVPVEAFRILLPPFLEQFCFEIIIIMKGRVWTHYHNLLHKYIFFSVACN